MGVRYASPRRPRNAAVSAGSARRFKARARTRRLTRLRPAVVLLVLLTLAAASGWVLLRSEWLSVTQVEVSGIERLRSEQVLEVAAVEQGAPLATVDLDAVGERILAALPPAERVEVRRAWPDTVGITVRERQAAIVVPGPEGVRLVDDDGVAFAVAPSAPAGVPVVEAAADVSTETLRAAATVATSLPPDIAEQVQGIRATSPDAIEMALTDDRTVLWGSAQRTARKAVVLEALMNQPASVYDVSAPDAPTTRD